MVPDVLDSPETVIVAMVLDNAAQLRLRCTCHACSSLRDKWLAERSATRIGCTT